LFNKGPDKGKRTRGGALQVGAQTKPNTSTGAPRTLKKKEKTPKYRQRPPEEGFPRITFNRETSKRGGGMIGDISHTKDRRVKYTGTGAKQFKWQGRPPLSYIKKGGGGGWKLPENLRVSTQ